MDQSRIDVLLQKNKEEKTYSLTFFPPKNPEEEMQLDETIQKIRLLNISPLFVSVTCGHEADADEHTATTVLKIKETTGWTVMPHVTCVTSHHLNGDYPFGLKGQKEIFTILERYERMNIKNIFALRGDLPKCSDKNSFKEFLSDIFSRNRSFKSSTGLIKFIHKNFPDFAIGAACYPDKHKDADNAKFDRLYTRTKITAGADFLMTQMCFSNVNIFGLESSLFKSLDKRVPILPGVLPIVNWDKTRDKAESYSVKIPDGLRAAMEKANGEKTAEMEIGLQYALRSCHNLIANGVKHIHFFTLNRHEVVARIVQEIYSK